MLSVNTREISRLIFLKIFSVTSPRSVQNMGLTSMFYVLCSILFTTENEGKGTGKHQNPRP